MSYETVFRLPALGEGDGGGRLVNWVKHPGEAFEKDDALVEVETDKAVIEVPAPYAGRMLEHIAGIDTLLNLDEPLARVEFEGDQPEFETAAIDPESQSIAAVPETFPVATEDSADTVAEFRTEHGRVRPFATPRARTLARESEVDLTTIEGSGKGGRIVARDVLGERQSVRRAPAAFANGSINSSESLVETSRGGVFLRQWTPQVQESTATLFLLHGLFADVDVWTANATVLARRGLSVIAADLPAHGASTCQAESFDEIVEIIAETVQTSVDGSVVLAGHSFGAAVAARLAGWPLLDISGLVLLAPIGLGTEIEQSFIDGMLNSVSEEALERELRKLTVRPQIPGSAYVRKSLGRLEAGRSQLEKICESAFRNGVQQVNIVRDLAESSIPARVIQGRLDAIVPWTHCLNAPPRIALHLLPDAGHMPQWEASALVAEVISAVCRT